jgi:hypothetical protein
MSYNGGVPGRTFNIDEVKAKIDVSCLIPVEEVDKSQINIVRPYAIYRVVPVVAVRTRISTDQDRNIAQWHHMQMCDRLDPGETIPIGSQERRRAFIMAAVSKDQCCEEDLLECLPIVQSRSVARRVTQKAIPNMSCGLTVAKHE